MRGSRGKRRTLWRVALALAWLPLAAGAIKARAQTMLWSVSLKPAGWQDPYAQVSKTKPVDWDTPVFRQELAVDGDGDVYAGLSIIGEGPDKTKMLRVVELEGKTGSVVRQTDFATPKLDRTAVLLANDGALLVIAGDRVQRVNADGKTQQSVPLPAQPDMNPGLWVNESPSGKTLLLTTDEKKFLFVRTDTLATTAECQSEKEEFEELNDSVAVSLFDGPHGFELHTGQFCARMSELWSVASSRSSDLRLLNNHRILELGLEHVRLLTLKDKTVWNWDPPARNVPEAVSGVAVSSSENRVAFPLVIYHDLPRPQCHDVCPLRSLNSSPQQPPCELCPGTPKFETLFQGIVVLDTATGKEVGMVPLQKADSNKLAFSLSPDGRRLAVMNDSMVELWNLANLR